MCNLTKQKVIFEDLGIINYKSAWDYQELLVKENLEIKKIIREHSQELSSGQNADDNFTNSSLQINDQPLTINHLLF